MLEFQLESISPYRMFAMQVIENRPDDLLTSIPFLPIELFKTQEVLANGFEPVLHFESSGTTSTRNSIHRVADKMLYERSIRRGFEISYGPPVDYVFFALLPSYLERENSSLVYMVKHLMDLSGQQHGGFYKFDYDRLVSDMQGYTGNAQKILIGVSFALWEMAEKFPILDLSDTIVMETGGMKGKRREIIREELHQILCRAFQLKAIHSEYGMTELLSQAYSHRDGLYTCPPWMKVLVRDPYDPFDVRETGKGALNIIDLANMYSCSFIATNDLGQVHADGSFEVIGRMDDTALRGCNLMF